MKVRISGLLAMAAVLAGVSSVMAAPAPVSIDFTGLRAIQKFTLDSAADDAAFVLVDGVAAGADFASRLPEAGKTWAAAPKKPAVSEKAAISLWKGELKDGEFAVVTVILFQGENKDAAASKAFQQQIIEASKKAPEFAKKMLTVDDFKALTGEVVKHQWQFGSLVKSQQPVVAAARKTFARSAGGDHYGGLFNVVVWNDGAAVRKRVLPVGVTYGEHYGTDEKVYTKLKFTRDNVFNKDEKGEWSSEQLSPLSDDELTVHVKMLQNETIQRNGAPARKTTDYLGDVQVQIGGKPAKWRLQGEETGVDEIHRYWQYAE